MVVFVVIVNWEIHFNQVYSQVLYCYHSSRYWRWEYQNSNTSCWACKPGTVGKLATELLFSSLLTALLLLARDINLLPMSLPYLLASSSSSACKTARSGSNTACLASSFLSAAWRVQADTSEALHPHWWARLWLCNLHRNPIFWIFMLFSKQLCARPVPAERIKNRV